MSLNGDSKREGRQTSQPPIGEGTKTTIYVGTFEPNTVTKQDVEEKFGSVGNMRDCQFYETFAFCDYETEVDAQHAVDEFHGENVFGAKLRVELSHRPFIRRTSGRGFYQRGGFAGNRGGRFNNRGNFRGGFRGSGRYDNNGAGAYRSHSDREEAALAMRRKYATRGPSPGYGGLGRNDEGYSRRSPPSGPSYRASLQRKRSVSPARRGSGGPANQNLFIHRHERRSRSPSPVRHKRGPAEPRSRFIHADEHLPPPPSRYRDSSPSALPPSPRSARPYAGSRRRSGSPGYDRRAGFKPPAHSGLGASFLDPPGSPPPSRRRSRSPMRRSPPPEFSRGGFSGGRAGYRGASFAGSREPYHRRNVDYNYESRSPPPHYRNGPPPSRYDSPEMPIYKRIPPGASTDRYSGGGGSTGGGGGGGGYRDRRPGPPTEPRSERPYSDRRVRTGFLHGPPSGGYRRSPAIDRERGPVRR